MMPTDQMFRQSGGWALASDGASWVLQRRKGARWQAVAFVRSTKGRLAQVMAQNAVGSPESEFLLCGLPDTYDEWKRTSALPTRA